MKKIIIACIVLAFFIVSCQNGRKKEIENLKECYISDSTMYFKIPSYMYKRKEDSIAIFYEGNDRHLGIMKTKLPYKWDMYSFAQRMIGNNRRELTLVSENDSLLAYEIQKGLIHIPAATISVYKKSGYSILLYTFGLDKDLHMIIGSSIQCKSVVENKQ